MAFKCSPISWECWAKGLGRNGPHVLIQNVAACLSEGKERDLFPFNGTRLPAGNPLGAEANDLRKNEYLAATFRPMNSQQEKRETPHFI